MKIEKLADKVEQWVQCEANKQQSKWEVGRTKHLFLGEFATKLDDESKSNGNRTIWRHICEQVARRRDREKSQSENLRKRSRFWSRDSIVEDASHYLRFLHCSHWPSGQMNLHPIKKKRNTIKKEPQSWQKEPQSCQKEHQSHHKEHTFLSRTCIRVNCVGDLVEPPLITEIFDFHHDT